MNNQNSNNQNSNNQAFNVVHSSLLDAPKLNEERKRIPQLQKYLRYQIKTFYNNVPGYIQQMRSIGIQPAILSSKLTSYNDFEKNEEMLLNRIQHMNNLLTQNNKQIIPMDKWLNEVNIDDERHSKPGNSNRIKRASTPDNLESGKRFRF